MLILSRPKSSVICRNVRCAMRVFAEGSKPLCPGVYDRDFAGSGHAEGMCSFIRGASTRSACAISAAPHASAIQAIVQAFLASVAKEVSY